MIQPLRTQANSVNGMSQFERVRVKPLCARELSDLYDTTPRIFRNWISIYEDKIETRIGHFYSVAQVRLILIYWGSGNQSFEFIVIETRILYPFVATGETCPRMLRQFNHLHKSHFGPFTQITIGYLSIFLDFCSTLPSR